MVEEKVKKRKSIFSLEIKIPLLVLIITLIIAATGVVTAYLVYENKAQARALDEATSANAKVLLNNAIARTSASNFAEQVMTIYRKNPHITFNNTQEHQEYLDSYNSIKESDRSYSEMQINLSKYESLLEVNSFYLAVYDRINSTLVYVLNSQGLFGSNSASSRATPSGNDTLKYSKEMGNYIELSPSEKANYTDSEIIGYLAKRNGASVEVATAGIYIYNNQEKNYTLYIVSEISLQPFVNDSISFFTIVSIVIASITVFIILLSIIYTNRRVVKPLKNLSLATSNIVKELSNINVDPNSVTLQKVKIKSNDEIKDLHLSIIQMNDELRKYIDEVSLASKKEANYLAELNIAEQIQKESLPPAISISPNYDIYATMLTAKEVGGDFYDYFMVDANHLAFLIADVTNKGVPAALFMMKAKALIKQLTLVYKDVSLVFNKVNNLLLQNNSAGLFITAFEGILNLLTGEIEYCNAGHEKPLLYDGNEYKFLNTKSNFVLSGIEDFYYEKEITKLKDRDRILLFTDGVSEAINESNQLYGRERIVETLNSRKLNENEVIDVLKDDVYKFIGKASQSDDITIFSLEFKQSEQLIFKDDFKLSYVDQINDMILKNLDFISPKCSSEISIIIDEIYSNIYNYGLKNKVNGFLKVIKTCDDKSLTMYFIDNGVKFNLLESKAPSTSLSAEERQIGGLGIMIAKSLADDISYSYDDGYNILSITKKYY
ncbi:MAG: SpoIIE family protein phosphatase [Bacilli bacterium]|nr:SpoIIE family protein phosphatase [Bacilli bacterium]